MFVEKHFGPKGNKMGLKLTITDSNIPSIFYSKKFWVSFAGIIFAILASQGWVFSEDVRSSVIELIMVIVAAFNVGQGVADGLSAGKTSGVAHMLEIRRMKLHADGRTDSDR